ncbi:MAG: ABC transporter permease [Proteobacteria bacterium]|nr:ABC transporter permease [Pseudomonadota bacterium]
MEGFVYRRFAAVAKKEFLHVIRDWRSLVLAIAIPIFLISLFGWALNMDLTDVPTAVWDQSRTPESRELLSLFEGSPYFSVDHHVDSFRQLRSLVDKGSAMVALTISSDFADRVRAGKDTEIQAVVDGSDANNANLALGYVTAVGHIYNARLAVAATRSRGLGDPKALVTLEPRAWYNPDLKSKNVVIPGIIALVMVVLAAMLTSVTVAREWETGTMERLISTPIRVPELVLGKVVPYFVVGMTDVAISVFMSRFIFHVPIRGSLGLLFAASAVFLAGALFLGLFLSIALKTQVLANQIALFSGYLPTLFLSGFVFGIHNMPQAIQALTYVVPARYFIAMLRGIYLKGVGLEVLWADALLLALYAALMIFLAHRKMKLMLD